MPTSAHQGTAVMDRRTGHEAEQLGSLRQPFIQLSHLSEGRNSFMLTGFFKELNDTVMTVPTRKNSVSLSLEE